MNDAMQSRWVPLLLALAVALAMGAATFILEQSEGKRLAQMHRVEVLNQVSAARARLEGSIQSRLVLARGLALLFPLILTSMTRMGITLATCCCRKWHAA